MADGPPPAADHTGDPPPGRVGEVARLFLLLGVVGFGGPAAHIALMRREVVERRGWVADHDFLDWVGATNLIPGPNSTELAIHLGGQRAGWRGLVTAGVCFIVPAVLIVGVIAWLYDRYGTSAALLDLRYGILPVILAIVVHAVVGLGRTAVKDAFLGVLAGASFAAYLADVHELLVLAVAGLLAVAWHARHRLGRGLASFVPLAVSARANGTDDVSLTRLFLVFLEIGSVLYGSGYVLLAFLERNLVDELGWITDEQLLDAIAVGQVTPGPVFTTATFIGWQAAGAAGAAVATVGIFLPAFVFVALLGKLVPWMRRNPPARAFLDGVNVASLGLMAGVVVKLAGSALVDAVTVAMWLVALVLLLRYRLNSAWLVAGGFVVSLVHLVVT